jgi:hypothetical protein
MIQMLEPVVAFTAPTAVTAHRVAEKEHATYSAAIAMMVNMLRRGYSQQR